MSANISKITKNQCLEWVRNSKVNPMTGRSIQEGKPTYNAILENCRDKHGINLEISDYQACVDALRTGSAQDVRNAFIKIRDNDRMSYFVGLVDNIPLYVHAVMYGKEKAEAALSLFGRQLHLEAIQAIVDELYVRTTGNEDVFEVVLQNIADPRVVAQVKLQNETMFVYACRQNNEKLAEMLARHKVYRSASQIQNNDIHLIWAAFKGYTKTCEHLINDNNIDANVTDLHGKSALVYAIDSDKQETALKLIELGASTAPINLPYFIENAKEQAGLKSKVEDTMKRLSAKVYESFVAHDEQSQSLTSENHLYAILYYLKSVDVQKLKLSNKKRESLGIKLFVHLGVQVPHLTDSELYKEFVTKPKSWWTEKETINNLKIIIRHVGVIADVRLFEIKVVHNDHPFVTIGSLGNLAINNTNQTISEGFIKQIERLLQLMMVKGKLLHTTFPYRSKIRLHMYNSAYTDVLKVPVLHPNLKGLPKPIESFTNIFNNVIAVIKKERHIPEQILSKLPTRMFSKTFASQVSKAKANVGNPLSLRDEGTLSSESKKSISPIDRTKLKGKESKGPRVNMKDVILSALSDKRGAAYITAAKTIARVNTPIRKIEDVTRLRGIGPVITQVIQTEFDKHPQIGSPSDERKELAKKSIARFARRRVNALRKYYDDSIAYMDSLPDVQRNMIYKALNGKIMQGPYSESLKRVNTLLYAKKADANILRSIVEVVARAPTLPIRYSLYRGMHMTETPTINETEIFQEIPFSTTFISNYALGWILAKKGVALGQAMPCCLFELRCHQGTKGLYLSKLPWMDPWTSHNASIFDRIAPNNLTQKFHIKVNSQNELLMFPYRLKVVGKKTRTFKAMLDKQLETLDTHYEYDAKQRNLGSLFTYHEDLLSKEVNVYILELQPISLYEVKVMPEHKEHFASQTLQPTTQISITEPEYIYYSPEEIDQSLQNSLDALEKKGYCQVTKIIEKGRYVGSKTF